MLSAGDTSRRMAARLKRSPASVERKLPALGLPTPAQRKKQLQGHFRAAADKLGES